MKQDRGFTNGLSKSKLPSGKSSDSPNGLTNGMGNNHLGMINGNGHTNGMVNGSYKQINDIKINFNNPHKVSKKFAILAVAILLLSIISISIIIEHDINAIRPVIDGDYREWDDMNDIGFGKLGIIQQDNKILFALERNNILSGNGNITESYYFFINDINSEEGFYLGYDTYEYYIDIFGRDDRIFDARGYQFDESKKNNDWAGFTSKYSSYSIPCANNKTIIEFEINSIMLGHQSFDNKSLLIYHYDTDGGYEYSQILDLNQNSTSNQISNTRSEVSITYKHIFEKNELNIITEKPLAYLSIPYEIRIIQDRIETEIFEPISEQINITVIEDKYIEPIKSIMTEERGTKIIIDYYNHKPDMIEQCGGHIINSTVDVNITDKGLTLYNFNKTVKSMKITGDINTTIIGDITRSGAINISNSSLPPKESTGSISSMKAEEYDTTEQEITVDGILDEYIWGRIPTDQYYIDETYDMKIWVVRNSTHLFIGVRSIDDVSDETLDKTDIYFDTDNDKTITPDMGDKKIRIDGTDTITYYEGNGTAWESTTTPIGWDAGESLTDSDRTYEFTIPISDLNENEQFNSVNTTIGFGVWNIDEITIGTTPRQWHLWYPDAYENADPPTTQYDEKPDTWADLEFGNNFIGTEFTDYDMFSPITSTAITIDGDLDETAWSTTAYDWTIDCNGHEAYLYVMKDTTYLYIGWYSKNYNTLEANDFCQIYFDTDYDGTLDPDAGDKLLEISNDNSTAYFYGTGTGWASGTMPTNWQGSNGITTGNITWEARFTLSELDTNNNFGATDEIIGFGIKVGHSSTTPSYTLSWPDACEHDFEMSRYEYHPESWGDLIYAEIPEFSQIIPMITFMMSIMILFTIKRKDKDREEYDN